MQNSSEIKYIMTESKLSRLIAIYASVIFIIGSGLFVAASVVPVINSPLSWVTWFYLMGSIVYLGGSVLFFFAAVYA